MSTAEDQSVVELTVELSGLSISVRGSPRAATRFVQNLASESRNNSLEQESAVEPSAISAAAASFDSALPLAPEPVPAAETRVSIQSTFPSLPSYWRIQAGTQLSSTRHTPFFRANRAWTAGCWAKAVRQGRVGSPNRSETVDLGNRIWCVVKSDRFTGARCFSTSAKFQRAVGRLEGTDTICHAFPTQLEGQIYFAAAGVDFPAVE